LRRQVGLGKGCDSTERFHWIRHAIPFIPTGSFRLAQDGANDGTVDVGEAMVAAAVTVGQALVVESEAVEEGGVEIVDVDRVLHGLAPEIVGLPMDQASADAASGHPDGETLMVVVAAVVLAAVGGASEFASPEHEGVFEQPAGARSCSRAAAGRSSARAFLRSEFSRFRC